MYSFQHLESQLSRHQQWVSSQVSQHVPVLWLRWTHCQQILHRHLLLQHICLLLGSIRQLFFLYLWQQKRQSVQRFLYRLLCDHEVALSNCLRQKRLLSVEIWFCMLSKECLSLCCEINLLFVYFFLRLRSVAFSSATRHTQPPWPPIPPYFGMPLPPWPPFTLSRKLSINRNWWRFVRN